MLEHRRHVRDFREYLEEFDKGLELALEGTLGTDKKDKEGGTDNLEKERVYDADQDEDGKFYDQVVLYLQSQMRLRGLLLQGHLELLQETFQEQLLQ